MELPTQKLIHTFGALADLGQEITDSQDVSDMVLTSLHLLLGALAIRRGAIFEYVPEETVLRLVASRGIGSEFPQNLEATKEVVAALLGTRLSASPPAELVAQTPELHNLFSQCAPDGGFEIQIAAPMLVRG